ncbi:MAG: hypothetical protein E6I24_04750 [Chloroflexi bacterium]|nr:MAG: hypothetical protein E6I24_04750 [Chloroflexota bacterium]
MRNELESPRTRPVEFRHRYSTNDLSYLTDAERRRFLASGDPDPQTNPAIAWELLYRIEPELYDRLIRPERIHPAVLDWLPHRVHQIVEVGAGTGRLTSSRPHRCASGLPPGWLPPARASRCATASSTISRFQTGPPGWSWRAPP